MTYKNPPLVWLSFATEEGLLGTLVTHPSEGRDAKEAFWNTLQRLHAEGLNPGGDCMPYALSTEAAAMVPEAYKNRLLTRDESEGLDAIFLGEVQ